MNEDAVVTKNGLLFWLDLENKTNKNKDDLDFINYILININYLDFKNINNLNDIKKQLNLNYEGLDLSFNILFS